MAFDDILNAKQLQREREKFEAEARNMCATQGMIGRAADQCGKTELRPSEREEAEKRVGYHRTEADRADRAAAFFREHPEFDEFIGLIRNGVIQIAVLLLALLLPALAHSQAVAVSNGSTTAQSLSTPVSFTSAAGPLAVEYNGQWSAASVERETLDIADFGKVKANHVLVNGLQLEMPGPGVNLYMGGVALQPDLSSLFKHTNLPTASLGAFVDGNVGVGTPATGASEISWMAGGGVTYKLASALTWQPLTVQYGRFGAQGFVAMSTQLEFAFKR